MRHRKNADALKPFNSPLSVQELQRAQEVWVKYAQQQCFSNEIKNLNIGKTIIRGPLKHLSPFMDNGILRVGGRLEHSKESFSRKNPAVLPCKHHVTELIFHSYHLQLLHMGPQGLLANIRLLY